MDWQKYISSIAWVCRGLCRFWIRESLKFLGIWALRWQLFWENSQIKQSEVKCKLISALISKMQKFVIGRMMWVLVSRLDEGCDGKVIRNRRLSEFGNIFVLAFGSCKKGDRENIDIRDYKVGIGPKEMIDVDTLGKHKLCVNDFAEWKICCIGFCWSLKIVERVNI